MDTKALRQKILDLAIRGKLVPQDPNDEPASVLLERIRAEKQQMVKEGRLKAKDIKNDTIIFRGEDNLHYEKFADGSVKCIEDEIPFEVPEGWAWCRLGSVSSAIQYGLSNSAKTQGTHRLLRITDIQNGKVNWENVPFTTVEEPTAFLLTKGDIVFARSGSTVGKSFLIKEIPYPAVYASYLIKIQLLGNLRSDYIYQFFNSECYWEQITDKSVGVGQPNCNGSSLKELFIPLPPINEQDQIAVAADKYLKYADEIEEDKKALASLVSMTKSKILNLAIQGKLVPQDENDEPASVLLKRIRTEKDELIKTGKIKRDKKESIIFRGDDNSYYEKFSDETVNCIDNEIPFEIPDNWGFEKIRNIFIINPKNNLDDNTTVSFIPMTMIDDQFSGKYKYEIKTWNTCKKGFTHFASNDVGFAKISPCFENRKSVLFSKLENNVGAGTTELYIIRRFTDDIIGKYLLYFVKTEYFISKGKGTFSGVVGQQRVDKDVMLDTYIPIPPLKIQKKIVQKIELLIEQLDNIENNLK